MIVKILGLLDFFSVIILLFAGILPPKLIMIFALFLLAKGVFFSLTGNIVSIIDVLVAIYMVFLAYGLSSKPITVIALIFLAQKAFLSFI